MSVFWGVACFLAWLVLGAWVFDVQDPYAPLFPEAMASGYLLIVVVLFASLFMLSFQVLAFSRSRNSVSHAWDAINVLGAVTAIAIIPTPPIVIWAFLTAYLILLTVLRYTMVRSAVLRCYKAEYDQRRQAFQRAAVRAADPESAARMI